MAPRLRQYQNVTCNSEEGAHHRSDLDEKPHSIVRKETTCKRSNRRFTFLLHFSHRLRFVLQHLPAFSLNWRPIRFLTTLLLTPLLPPPFPVLGATRLVPMSRLSKSQSSSGPPEETGDGAPRHVLHPYSTCCILPEQPTQIILPLYSSGHVRELGQNLALHCCN